MVLGCLKMHGHLLVGLKPGLQLHLNIESKCSQPTSTQVIASHEHQCGI